MGHSYRPIAHEQICANPVVFTSAPLENLLRFFLEGLTRLFFLGSGLLVVILKALVYQP